MPINSIEENVFTDSKDNNCLNILDTLSNDVDEQSQITNKIALSKIINALVPRDRQIILLRYFKGKTQTDVAKILGISQVQVSRIEKRILNKMKEQLV